MVPTYEIGLMDKAIGVEILITEEEKDFLSLYLKKDLSYALHMERTFQMKTDVIVPFGEESFGYYGNLKIDSDGKILALFSQEKPLIYLVGSLFLLFKCLNGVCVFSSDPNITVEPFKIQVELVDRVDGYNLFADCSADFNQWLCSKYKHGSDMTVIEARNSILAGGRVIKAGMPNLWESNVKAEMLAIGGFVMHCDRNCCCMGNTQRVGKDDKFHLSTHNSDNAYNLLTFLAGLAGLANGYHKDNGRNI